MSEVTFQICTAVFHRTVLTEGGLYLGEWCTAGEVMIPESFVNTYTGMFGTNILIDVLFENGFYDTAYNLLTAKPHLPKNFGYAKGFLETRFGRIDVEI